MTRDNEYQHGTVEYLSASITGSVSLTAQTVVLSIDGGATWLDATWQGSAGTTRTARTDDPVDFGDVETGVHTVLARVTDNPEVPIIDCGLISVVS